MSAHGFLNVSRLMWIHACTCHISDEKLLVDGIWK